MTQVLKNVYFDTAASPFLYHDRVYGIAMELVGINKIVFGSDYPLISPNVYLREMVSAGYNKNDIYKACFKNAAKLLKI